MPEITNGMAHYNLDDPEDLAVLIDRGLIWKGGPQAINKGIAAVLNGAVPRPTRNVPPHIASLFDRQNVPLMGADVDPATQPIEAEPNDFDEEAV